MRMVAEAKRRSQHEIFFGTDNEISKTILRLARRKIELYWHALLRMTPEDAMSLREYTRQYVNVIPEIDAAIGNPLRKAILKKINNLLCEICDRETIAAS